METKHTPEPWRARTGYDRGEPVRLEIEAGVHGIATMIPYNLPNGSEADLEREEANAERIVACVNGCAGIADPSAVADMKAALADPCMMPALEEWAKGKNANAVRCLQNARAALAKAEGRAVTCPLTDCHRCASHDVCEAHHNGTQPDECETYTPQKLTPKQQYTPPDIEVCRACPAYLADARYAPVTCPHTRKEGTDA